MAVYVYDLFPWGSLRKEISEMWKADTLAQPLCVCVYVQASLPWGSGRAETYCRIKSNYSCSSVMHGGSRASICDCKFMLVIRNIVYAGYSRVVCVERVIFAIF